MSNDEHMGESAGITVNEAQDPGKTRKKRGWLRWLFLSLALLLVAFLAGSALLFHFYADRIFRETFHEIVNRETNGAYTLTFDKFRIHYLKTEIEITNLGLFADTALQPADSAVKSQIKNPFSLQIPMLQLKGLDIQAYLRKKELHIRSFIISKPQIQLILNQDFKSSNDSLSDRLFSLSGVYGSIQKYFQKINIRNFAVDEASAIISDQRNTTEKKLSVKNLTLAVNNFYLDSAAYLNPDQFFFTDSVLLQISNGYLIFSGGKQDFALQSLDFSSSGKMLNIGNLNVKTNRSQTDPEAVSWFDISIPSLEISGLDLKQPMEKKLTLEEISLIKPEISFHPALLQQTQKMTREDAARLIFSEISPLFNPFEVNRITIREGNFTLDDFKTDFADNLSLADFSLEIHHLLVDSAGYEARSPLFFVDGLIFTLRNQDLYLKQLHQQVSFDSLVFNTLSSTIEAGNVVLKARNTDAPGINADVRLPFLYIESKSITQDFLSNRLNLKELTLQSPDIQLRHRRSATAGNASDDFFTLEVKMKKFLKWLKADVIRLQDATFSFDDGEGVFKNQLTAGNINISLQDFNPAQKKTRNDQQILFSNAVNVQVNDLKIVLPDSVHQLKLNSFAMNTRDSALTITGFSLDTLALNQIGNNPTADLPDNFDARTVKLEGVDFYSLYRQKKTRIASVRLDSVHLAMKQSASKPEADTGLDTAASLPKFIQDFKIENFELDNGFFSFNSIENKPVAEAGGITLKLKNLLPPENDSIPFSTNQVDLKLKNASFRLPDNQHIVETGKLHLSSQDSVISVNNLVLRPLSYTEIGNQELIRVELPAFSTSGTDILGLYRNMQLTADSLGFKNPDIRIILPARSGSKKQIPEFPGSEVINKALTSLFPAININTINVDNSHLELFGGKTFNSRIISFDGMNMIIDDFQVDKKTRMTKDNFLFASDMSVEIESPFSLPINDTLAVNIEKMKMSTGSGSFKTEMLFVNFEPSNQNFTDQQFRQEVNLGLESVDLQGIDYFSLATAKKLAVDTVFIQSADVLVRQKRPDKKREISSIDSLNLYQFFYPKLEEINIGEIAVDNTQVKFEEKYGNDIETYNFNDIKANISNLLIDSANNAFDNRFLYSEYLSFSLEDYKHFTRDSLYALGAGKISFNSKNSLLTVDSGFLQPQLDDTTFARQAGVQTDRMQFVFEQARLENLRLIDFILDRKLHINKIMISEMNFDDYRNKNYPFPENHFPKLPGSALQDLPFALDVDTLQIYNSDFQYREYVYPALQPGAIWFSDMSITGFNLTNITSKIEHNPFMLVLASGKLMDEGNISLLLKFDLESQDDYFTARGMLNKMDLVNMNPLLENVAFVKIKKGVNNLAQFDFTANDDFARGRMKFYYKDLGIRLIDKQTLQSDGFGESVASFIANTFIVRTDNPNKFLFYRLGDIYFMRDKQKSFFNYLAKSSLSGVNSTIRGGNEERKEKRKKRKLEQQLIKEGRLPEEISGYGSPMKEKQVLH